MPSPVAVTLADCALAGIRLRPTEAVTIVRAIVLKAADGRLPGVPSPHVVRLSPCGGVTVEGPVVASGRPVPRAAQLLAALLRGSRRVGAEPSPLRKVIAKALQDPPGFATLHDFADALAPFAAHDSQTVIADLAARCGETAPIDSRAGRSGPITGAETEVEVMTGISEVRRARRETGLSLDEVSSKCRIPVSMLRQLEWGYVRNWPKGLYGRTQLVRYARAAGLSLPLVIDAFWPLIDAPRDDETCAAPPPPEVSPIVIIEPTFEADEVLFEAEQNLPASPAAGSAASKHDAGPTALGPPRRSSMAAVAVLGLIAAGAAWAAVRTPVIEPRAAPQLVRRLSAKSPGPEVPDTGVTGTRTPGSPARRAGVGTSGTSSGPGVRSAAERLTSPDIDAGAMPVETGDEDDAVAQLGSIAAVAFVDPVQPAEETADSGGGLGLRIMRVIDGRHARPSPDGTRVAFDSDRDGPRGVFVADASGRNLRRVSGDGSAVAPNWSPDGRTLSFARAELENPAVWNLWALDLDSGESRRLTSGTTGRPTGGAWFPDGRHIAYSRANAVVVLDADGVGTPSVYPSPSASRTAGPPAVSPDGRWVIYQLSGDGGWLLDLADGSSRKVLSDEAVGGFTWSPDGSRVAYYNGRDGEWRVWIMAAR